MKKFILLIAILMIMVGATSAFAESHGSSILPMVQIYYKNDKLYLNSTIHLSNITEEAIDCTVSLYADDGTEVGSMAKIYNGSQTGSSTTLTDSGKTFTIPANGSRRVVFDCRPTKKNFFGYAKIEWSSKNEKIAEALIGGMKYLQRHGGAFDYSSGYVLINNGQPF